MNYLITPESYAASGDRSKQVIDGEIDRVGLELDDLASIEVIGDTVSFVYFLKNDDGERYTFKNGHGEEQIAIGRIREKRDDWDKLVKPLLKGRRENRDLVIDDAV